MNIFNVSCYDGSMPYFTLTDTGKISLIKNKRIMTTIQFLLTQTNASEYEDIRDETTMRWDVIANIMEDYHKYKLNLPDVGCNEVAVWDKYTPEFKKFVQTCCIEKEVDKIYTYNGLNCDLDHLYFKYKRMRKIT